MFCSKKKSMRVGPACSCHKEVFTDSEFFNLSKLHVVYLKRLNGIFKGFHFLKKLQSKTFEPTLYVTSINFKAVPIFKQ